MPFFLVGVGILFVTLVLNRYEYAPTLFIWLVGIFCILGGVLLFAIRMIYRIRSRVEDSYEPEEEY
jgi:NhaP-type Na+/H+ or K+/H+ antiporter